MEFPLRGFLLSSKSWLGDLVEPLTFQLENLAYWIVIASLISPLSLNSRKAVLWIFYSSFYPKILAKHLNHHQLIISERKIKVKKVRRQEEGRRKWGSKGEDASQSPSYSAPLLPPSSGMSSIFSAAHHLKIWIWFIKWM